ncbi:meromycolate extension acyl carrier protein AcpM [Nocardioides korecus]
MTTPTPPLADDRETVLLGLGELLGRITGGAPARPVPLSPEQRWVEDLRVDSLSMVELLEGASRRFGVRIVEEDTVRFVRVEDLVDHLVGVDRGPAPRPRRWWRG